MNNPLVKFSIPRKEWARGKDAVNYGFWSTDYQKGCVFGHYFMAAGYTVDEIAGHFEIEQVLEKEYLDEDRGLPMLPDTIEWMFDVSPTLGFVPSSQVEAIMHINDTSFSHVPDAEREAKLIKEFEKVGVELTFTD